MDGNTSDQHKGLMGPLSPSVGYLPTSRYHLLWGSLYSSHSNSTLESLIKFQFMNYYELFWISEAQLVYRTKRNYSYAQLTHLLKIHQIPRSSWWKAKSRIRFLLPNFLPRIADTQAKAKPKAKAKSRGAWRKEAKGQWCLKCHVPCQKNPASF